MTEGIPTKRRRLWLHSSSRHSSPRNGGSQATITEPAPADRSGFSGTQTAAPPRPRPPPQGDPRLGRTPTSSGTLEAPYPYGRRLSVPNTWPARTWAAFRLRWTSRSRTA
jgi:hypothetical protein